jgi:hypothetical protein
MRARRGRAPRVEPSEKRTRRLRMGYGKPANTPLDLSPNPRYTMRPFAAKWSHGRHKDANRG